MKNQIVGYLGLILLALLSSCGQKEEDTIQAVPEEAPPPYYADTLMPSSITTYDIVKVGEVRTVKPETAADFFGSSAVDYQAYRFVGMSAAGYSVKGVPISVEIAQFPTADDAYGFFARLQSFGMRLGMLGSESFESGNSLYFAAGDYVVTLSIAESTLEAANARSRLALEINSRITQRSKPTYFLLFPSASKIGASNRYYPDGFLEGVGLEQVYATSYAIENDSTLFFLMMDEGGIQYSKLAAYASDVGTVVDMPDGFNFPDFSVAFEHPRHGLIVAGLVRKKLVGIIGYNPKPFEKLATGWVDGLQM